MPPSAERDWMLSEVRARAVDIESGVKPAALRAVPGETEPVPAPAPVPPRPARVPRAAQPRREPAPAPAERPRPRAEQIGVASLATPRERTAPTPAVNLLEDGHLLSLDDAPGSAGEPGRAWSRGLRG
jgi:hypothetical protein